MKKNIKNLPVRYTLYFFMLVLTGSWCDSKEAAPSNNSDGNTNSITTEQQKNNAPGTGSTAKENGNTGKPAGAAGTRVRKAEKEKEAGPREGEGKGSEAKEAERETGEKEARTGSERKEQTEGDDDDDDNKNEDKDKNKNEDENGETNKPENGDHDNDDGKNKEEEQTTEPKKINFTTYLNGLEELEKDMVQKHSELKEAFTYFKAIEKLVSKFNTTYKARIDCINKMLLE